MLYRKINEDLSQVTHILHTLVFEKEIAGTSIKTNKLGSKFFIHINPD